MTAALKRPVNILVVDDEQTTRDYLVFHLTNKNYSAFALESGEALLAALDTEIPDLILLDVFLPDASGLELCSSIKTDLGENAPAIIVMSAWVSQADMASYLSRGADAFIQKPVHPRELMAQLEALLRSRQARQNLTRKIAFLENILEHLPVPVAVLKPDLELVYCSRDWLDSAGAGSGRALNRKCFQVLGRRKPCPGCPVLESADTGRKTSQNICFAEHEAPVRVTAAPLPDKDNQTMLFIETLFKPDYD